MTTKASTRRAMIGIIAAAADIIATAAFAQSAAQPVKIDAADTAWMITATALVLMMSIPGLALFYAGMVRKKNVLATMAQTFAAVALGSIVWVAVGYSLVFSGNGSALGTFDRIFLNGMGMDSANPLAKNIPEVVFMLYQMTFAVITVALVAGSVADRMRFSAFLWFALGWLILVYVPIAHWVWGGGFLQQDVWLAKMGFRDFAGSTVVHTVGGAISLVAITMLDRKSVV